MDERSGLLLRFDTISISMTTTHLISCDNPIHGRYVSLQNSCSVTEKKVCYVYTQVDDSFLCFFLVMPTEIQKALRANCSQSMIFLNENRNNNIVGNM